MITASPNSRHPAAAPVARRYGGRLSLSDARLTALTDALAATPHIKRLRLHTRQPIVLPSRVDAGLVAWLPGYLVPRLVREAAGAPAKLTLTPLWLPAGPKVSGDASPAASGSG